MSLAFRVMGSVGSTFSADPRDPGVGRGRQGSAFRDGQKDDLLKDFFCFIVTISKVSSNWVVSVVVSSVAKHLTEICPWLQISTFHGESLLVPPKSRKVYSCIYIFKGKFGPNGRG